MGSGDSSCDCVLCPSFCFGHCCCCLTFDPFCICYFAPCFPLPFSWLFWGYSDSCTDKASCPNFCFGCCCCRGSKYDSGFGYRCYSNYCGLCGSLPCFHALCFFFLLIYCDSNADQVSCPSFFCCDFCFWYCCYSDCDSSCCTCQSWEGLVVSVVPGAGCNTMNQ